MDEIWHLAVIFPGFDVSEVKLCDLLMRKAMEILHGVVCFMFFLKWL